MPDTLSPQVLRLLERDNTWTGVQTFAGGGGGSGDVSAAAVLAANAVVLGDTGAKTVKTLASLGTTGQVLTSAGPGVPPAFVAPLVGDSFIFSGGNYTTGASPADATTYIIGMAPGFDPTASDPAIFPAVMPRAGTVKVVHGQVVAIGPASAGSCIVRIKNITAGTTEIVTSTLAMTGSLNVFNNTAMTLAFAAGDRLEITLLTPTWVTNPTGVFYSITVYVEY